MLLRSAPWVFGPRDVFERVGDVDHVVFPCGYTVSDDGDTLNLYYGAADSSVGLVRASLNELLAWLEENGQSHPLRRRGDAG